MKQPVVLRIYKADQLVGVKQFTEGQMVIGRQSDVQVPLSDDSVSIIHAAVEERDGNYYICDLGSESGTFRNDETVLDARLESGDIIRVGDFRIEFFIGVPRPKTPPAAAPQTKPVVEEKVPASAPIATHSPAPPIVETPAPVVSQAPTPKVPDSIPFQASSPSKPASAVRSSAGPAAVVSSMESTAAANAPFSNSPDLRPPGTVGGSGSRTRKGRPAHSGKAEMGKRTFAPPSKYQSFREFVKPSKGTVVEVLVMWRERVISAHHFSRKAVITMGSHPSCDIVLPVLISKQRKVPLVRIDANATVLISSDYTGELIKGQQSQTFAELARANRLTKDASGNAFALALDQGEMVRIELGDQVSIIVRYTSDSPKPLAAPLLDLTPAELAGVIMALVMVGVLWLYMFLYTPPKALGDDFGTDPQLVAKLELEKPRQPTPIAIPIEPETPVAPVPPTQSTPVPKPVSTESAKPAQNKAENPNPKPDPGKAANAAPNKNVKAPRVQTSTKQGGAVKVGQTEGAQAKSERDMKKVGVFSVFGGGKQNDTEASSTGKGELSGFADAATGKAGQNENRAGEGLGSKMIDTGRGGTGTAAVGISGGDPKGGRGSGNVGYGTGGVGSRKGVNIVSGGQEESFSGGYDKEAVRRVIQANLRSFRTCYERQLNRSPDLFGKVVIEWGIGEQGRVVSARTKSTEVGNQVSDCVRDIIRGLKFPEPPSNNEVTVIYPFYFSN